ncbi:MAG: PEP-CTERM sorting domain-containing protein [Kiritimatiellales bacterium]
MRTPSALCRIVLLSALLPLCGTAGLFNITVEFSAGMDESYQSAFASAASYWGSIITGYRIDSSDLQGITISANVATNDGVGGVLGSARPTNGYFFNNALLAGDSDVSDVLYATAGSMTFDSADVDNLISSGLWEQVIRHEMAHVIGFGTLWGYSYNGTVYNDFYTADSGQYTGAAALAAYQAEFDPSATYVPVELEGGGGTANGHWNEVDGGSALTGITDAEGQDMAYELMTGWLNSPTFVSDTTIAQFYDMGYTVIPEPSTVIMIAIICGLAGWIRRRFYD